MSKKKEQPIHQSPKHCIFCQGTDVNYAFTDWDFGGDVVKCNTCLSQFNFRVHKHPHECPNCQGTPAMHAASPEIKSVQEYTCPICLLTIVVNNTWDT